MSDVQVLNGMGYSGGNMLGDEGTPSAVIINVQGKKFGLTGEALHADRQ